MKTVSPIPIESTTADRRTISRHWLLLLIVILILAALVSSGGFQTYWNKERRLIAAANEIVTALNAYRAASPGTAKDFPLQLHDLLHDPRMLADKHYLATFPVDPITLKQDWGVVRNKDHQVIGVHSLSNDAPTWFAGLISFRGGDKYSDWVFVAE